MQTSTFRHGEHRSEALWAFGHCFQSQKDSARAREAIEHVLMTFPTPRA